MADVSTASADAAARERLEAQVAALRAEVDRLNGNARQQEEDALRRLLAAVRACQDDLPRTSKWLNTVYRVGFALTLELPGEHSTLEEFSA
jgi:hypothetical protein